MGDLVEQIYMGTVSIVSLAGVFGVLYLIMRASNSRWREFERKYLARDLSEPLALVQAGAVRIAQPGFRFGHLSGDLKARVFPPARVGVYAEGLSVAIKPPFKYGCRDLFLPFKHMTIEPAPWTIGEVDYGVRMDGVEGIEIQFYSTTLKELAPASQMLELMLRRAELRHRTASD